MNELLTVPCSKSMPKMFYDITVTLYRYDVQRRTHVGLEPVHYQLAEIAAHATSDIDEFFVLSIRIVTRFLKNRLVEKVIIDSRLSKNAFSDTCMRGDLKWITIFYND